MFDDIQWATPTFLDLLEHVAEWTSDAPILLLVIARPELLEARPGWGGGMLNTTTLQLEPLDERSMNLMLDQLPGGRALPQQLRDRVGAAAEGNPLFVEQLLAALRDDRVIVEDKGEWRLTRDPAQLQMPPTVELLVASRVDRLPADQKRVLERASVIGKRFGAAAVTALTPGDQRPSLREALLRLQRKEHIRLDGGPPEPGLGGDDDARFRFRHQLIRDAAYEALPKHERASLHEAFAQWLIEVTPGRLLELHEIVGHHFEQAYRYRTDLGARFEDVQTLAERAAEQFVHAARRAHAVGDGLTSVRLLERVLLLLPDDHPRRLAAIPPIVLDLDAAGAVERSSALIRELLERRDVEPATKAAALEASVVLIHSGGDFTEARGHVEEAVKIRRELGDPSGLAAAIKTLAETEYHDGHLTRTRELFDEATRLAVEAGDPDLETEIRSSTGRMDGFSMSTSDEIAAGSAQDLEFARGRGALFMESWALIDMSIAGAMQGASQRARAGTEQALAIFTELGLQMWVAAAKAALRGSGRGNRHGAARRRRASAARRDRPAVDQRGRAGALPARRAHSGTYR